MDKSCMSAKGAKTMPAQKIPMKMTDRDRAVKRAARRMLAAGKK